MTAPDMKPSEALRKARELITPEGAWIQGAHARDDADIALSDGYAEDAVCWCAIGALEKVTGKDWGGKALSVLQKTMGEYVAEYNDHPRRTHAEILNAFHKAEELALSEGR